MLAEASFLVMNNPELPKNLPKILLNQTLGVRVNWWFLLKRLPWFLKFLSYCRTAHVLHAARFASAPDPIAGHAQGID